MRNVIANSFGVRYKTILFAISGIRIRIDLLLHVHYRMTNNRPGQADQNTTTEYSQDNSHIKKRQG